MQFSRLVILFASLCLSACNQLPFKEEQRLRNFGSVQVKQIDSPFEAKELAKQHIDQNIPFLVIPGSIGSLIWYNDTQLENRYRFEFLDFGCVSPRSEIQEAYNMIIFDYLLATYGRTWLSEIRTDLEGLEKWKIENNLLDLKK